MLSTAMRNSKVNPQKDKKKGTFYRCACIDLNIKVRLKDLVKVIVAQLSLTFYDPMDRGLTRKASLSMEFFRQEYWSG